MTVSGPSPAPPSGEPERMAVRLDGLASIGRGLVRPECALATRSGHVIVPDWTGDGGVAVIAPDGAVGRVLAQGVSEPLRPNGIALEPDGSVLLAHLGAETGGLFRLRPDGAVETVLTELDGRPLPPCNFPYRDPDGGLWLTVSTRRVPRALGYRPDVDDGFVVRIDRRGARIVADGLGYTNEAIVSADGGTLYVNETFRRVLSAFPIHADGTLGTRREIARFGAGTFPDGLALDAEGGLWVTSIVSNRVIRVAPDGGHTIWLEDSDSAHLAEVEAAFQAGTMGRPHLDGIRSRVLRNVSNLAFAGTDLRRAGLGCLLGDRLACFEAPVAGHPMPHWAFDPGPLAAAARRHPVL